MENRRIREIQKTIHKCDGDTKKAFTRGIGYVIDGLQKVVEQTQCIDTQKVLTDKINSYKDIM